MLHNAIVHHLLTNAQPFPMQWPWPAFLLVYTLSMAPYGVGYPLGLLSCLLPAPCSPQSTH